MSQPTLLIPVVFPDPDPYPFPETMIDGLSAFDIVLFGYWEVPTDMDVDEARTAHRTEADAVLYDLAAAYSKAGARTDIQLHFGPPGEEEDTLRTRIAEQTHADGVFVPNPITSLGRVLVPIRDTARADQFITVVGALNEHTILDIELFHVASDTSGTSDAQQMLDDIREQLLDRGFPDPEVETTVIVDEDPSLAISERARSHDLVVMGATQQHDIVDDVFGDVYEYVADRSDDPIIVVRDEGN